jgi:hypothetical protein
MNPAASSVWLMSLLCCVGLAGLAVAQTPAPPPPKPKVPDELPAQTELLKAGLKLRLLAEHPLMMTPTALDVDAKGRLWVVNCHTHFAPEGYEGPKQDEILVLDAEGRLLKRFHAGTKSTMHLACGDDGWVYVAQRDLILRLRDRDGDLQSDERQELLRLDTLADYPHNGLSGMAWHPDGRLVLSMGENFGRDWTLRGSDGRKVSGRGEGGVFLCDREGRGLRRMALGFWNPFGIMVRPSGEIFAVENDPGSRPPCRLLEILEGADYGFQWVYGSAPVHPFVAWNGELRGTLGMIHPSSEGPCALLELGGGLLVSSWSDHSLDYFPMQRQGAGWKAQRVPLISGSDFFRPVAMARGPNGRIYFTDWVFNSYPVHGRGRLWELSVDEAAAQSAGWLRPQWPQPNARRLQAEAWRKGSQKPQLAQLMTAAKDKSDPVLADAALSALSREAATWSDEHWRERSDDERLWALVSLRRVDLANPRWLRLCQASRHEEIRFECLRWVADAQLKEFASWVDEVLTDPALSFRLFEAALAAANTLRGDPGAGVTRVDALLARLRQEPCPERLRAYVLRLLPPKQKEITPVELRAWARSKDAMLQLEAVRALTARGLSAPLALDQALPAALRAEAVLGVTQPETLKTLADDAHAAVATEARRALRAQGLLQEPELAKPRPALNDAKAWLAKLDALPGQADPEQGRRLFHSPALAMCAQCHRMEGRGQVVGPDLTLLSRQGDRLAVLRSLLEPSREVAPQFHPYEVSLRNGDKFVGFLLRSSSTEVFRDLTGREVSFPEAEVLSRREINTSIMPAGLPLQLTDGELRDLLAFLMAPR